MKRTKKGRSKILLADLFDQDSKHLSPDILMALLRQHDVRTAHDEFEILSHFVEHRPHCLLISAHKLYVEHPELLQKLLSAAQHSILPLIVLAHDEHEKHAIRALEEGALDYILTEQYSDEELLKEIKAHIKKTHEFATMLEKNSMFNRLLTQGGISEQTKKMVFEQMGARAVARAKQYERQMAVMLVHVEEYHALVKEYGKAFAEKLINTLIIRITTVLHANDSITRIDVSELGIILDEIREYYDASVAARQIIEAVSEPFTFEPYTVNVSITIGVACYPIAGQSYEELCKNAMLSVVIARRNGNNCFHFFTDELNQDSQHLLLIANALHHAVRNEELFLCYQPVIDLSTLKPIGLEVLLRWRHPTIGIIYPNDFIYLAERSGQINEIGAWVLTKACEQFNELLKLGIKLQKIYINVSAKQIESNFIDVVKTVLAKTNINPNFIGIELTETALATNISRAHHVMKQLQNLGIEIAIDDFGTGYFSLTFVKRLPFDAFKIDKSFVDGVSSSTTDEAIVLAILSLVKKLNVTVIAEGIETATQLQFLQEHGCLHGQGYYFSKPLEFDKLLAFLTKED